MTDITKKVIHLNSGTTLLVQARWCATFVRKLKGFMFHRQLTAEEGLVLVNDRDSVLQSAIHMLFVPFDLGVVWVNDAGLVVDMVQAKSWALNYAPKAPARYIIEFHPHKLAQIKIGDQIQFE